MNRGGRSAVGSSNPAFDENVTAPQKGSTRVIGASAGRRDWCLLLLLLLWLEGGWRAAAAEDQQIVF
ncbi:Hypothetical predicted protein [Podarcis lilfordi]|uniref:Uncharacterized protein n=1 Tax=Podarcis lilfordi TaxID=74358 RepID=A0AA35NU69_9SAUR|nr:Hypothetical predicted protein [Podarcis lilfordi]